MRFLKINFMEVRLFTNNPRKYDHCLCLWKKWAEISEQICVCWIQAEMNLTKHLIIILFYFFYCFMV